MGHEYLFSLVSAFAGKQTFRIFNSNVCLILKADGQVKAILVSNRPMADIKPADGQTIAARRMFRVK